VGLITTVWHLDAGGGAVHSIISRHLGSEAARLKFRAAPETQHRDRVLLKVEGGIDDELDAWRDLELLG
jgi:hypothetical protein